MQPDKAAAMLTKAQVDPDVIRALVLNIRYDGEKTVLTTGCAYQTFTMDKKCRYRLGQGAEKISGSEGNRL